MSVNAAARPQFCVATHQEVDRRLNKIEEKADSAADSAEDVKEAVAVHDAEIEAVKAYQTRQNGSLQRIESRIEKMYWWLIGAVVSMFAIGGGLMIFIATQLMNHIAAAPKP